METLAGSCFLGRSITVDVPDRRTAVNLQTRRSDVLSLEKLKFTILFRCLENDPFRDRNGDAKLNMFVLIQSSPLEITLDPVETEERLPSAAFDVTANWLMPFHQARINIKACWLEYSELNRFEEDLKKLVIGAIEKATLSNMSSEPIMHFGKVGNEFDFEFLASDSAKMGTVSIKTNLYEQEMIEITQNIKDWAKWW